jgi:secreted Zn-dependent insulinase-like peptidase
MFPSGPFERRLPYEDIELHFQSQNEKEENGAVIITYQSQIPGFKGKTLSSEESMQRSAAIRLLCSIIKEPFFNELRTKQQLGYIVSSYYDINFTSRQPDLVEALSTSASSPSLSTISVDSMVLYVLSRKEPPIEVTSRIDDFLVNFRSRLKDMDAAEIQGYADSLADSLTKPIRKLGEEAKYNFCKIRRYAPEVLGVESEQADVDLGWDNPQVMANALRGLDRSYLLQVFDELVLKQETRTRIVSTVYGKTFPMPAQLKTRGTSSTISSLEDLLAKRSKMIPFDPSTNYQPQSSSTFFSLVRSVGKHRTALHYAAAASMMIGVGAWAIGLKSSSCEKKQIK